MEKINAGDPVNLVGKPLFLMKVCTQPKHCMV